MQKKRIFPPSFYFYSEAFFRDTFYATSVKKFIDVRESIYFAGKDFHWNVKQHRKKIRKKKATFGEQFSYQI